MKLSKRICSLLLAILLMLSLCACGGTADDKPNDGKPGSGTTDDNGGEKPPAIGETMINAVHYGVDNTGKTDMTDKIIEMHEKGAELNLPIYYPNGTYLFNGLNLNFDSGVEFESMDGVLIRNSVADTNVINFDDDGNLIGLMHNHLEAKFKDENFSETYQNGNLVSPPLADISYDTVVDFVPYWYNDFGRESQLLSGGTAWKGWYDWQWNHHDIGTVCQAKDESGNVCGTKLPQMDDPYERAVCPQCGATCGYDQYDPDLHPLIGWYRGDDPAVLDWMTYWMLSYGIKQSTLLVGGLASANWTDPASGVHWVYELMNNTQNGKQMKYALLPNSLRYSDPASVRSEWNALFDDFYFNEQYKDLVYCYEKDGKRYPVVFLWSEEAVRYSFSTREGLIAYYKEVSQAFQAHGWDGFCILSNAGLFTNEGGAADRADMAAADVIWFSCAYAGNCIGNGATYEERSTKFYINPDTSCIYGVATGKNTHTPHPSNWNCPGNTPKLFGDWIKKAVDATTSVAERPQMITCYNVSEWSEGGPGLVPTVGQRFGYLEAIRDNIVVK